MPFLAASMVILKGKMHDTYRQIQNAILNKKDIIIYSNNNNFGAVGKVKCSG